MLTMLILLTLHFVGDFLLQSDWMALNKSKSWKALLWHTTVYSLVFLPFGLMFTLITWGLHTLQDAITSRITGKLWFLAMKPFVFKWDDLKHYENEWANVYVVNVKDTRHWFFVMIGLDQLIHFWLLAWTLTLVQS